MYANNNLSSKYLNFFLFIVLALIIFGLIFIYSSSSVFALEKLGSASYFVKKQLLGLFLGSCALILLTIIPINKIKEFSALLFLLSLFLTALTLVPGISHKIHGSSRWLSVFGFSFQPSELLKFSLIIYIAYLFDKRHARLSFFYGYLPILIILTVSALLLLKQPDFGLSVVLSLTTFILLFIAQFRAKFLLLTALSALPIVVFLVFFKAYRLKRILTFLDPWQDPKGAGFQIIQSLIAIGSGGFWGSGISNSKQKFFYLPMQHTDFIFSIIAEEIGFFGSVILIFLFILFLYYGLKLAVNIKDTFCSFVILGFVILISIQAIINFCVTIGIFPTKGIGLPFVSYGNSALICNMAMIGLIINCAKNTQASRVA